MHRPRKEEGGPTVELDGLGDVGLRIQRHGWVARWVPDDVVGDHIACYHVVLSGRRIRPRAAIGLGIPVNEIWVSNAWEAHVQRILFHELREIEMRRRGYGAREAHDRATRLEEERFGPRQPAGESAVG